MRTSLASFARDTSLFLSTTEVVTTTDATMSQQETPVLQGNRKLLFFSVLSIVAVALRAFGLIDESGVEMILSIAGGGFAIGNAGEHIGRGMAGKDSTLDSTLDSAPHASEGGFARAPALFVLLFASAAILGVLSGCGGAVAETVRLEPSEAWVEGEYRFEGEARYRADGDNVTDWRSEGSLDLGGSTTVVVSTTRGDLSFELVTGFLVEHDGDDLVVWFCPAVVGFFEDCFEARIAGQEDPVE